MTSGRMPPPVVPVAVLGVGVAAPTLRLAASDVGAAWGSGGGRGTVAVCDADEDTLTLGWQAATAALRAAGTGAADLAGLYWGTTRAPFAEGPSLAFLGGALGIAGDVPGLLASGSPHAGMEALGAAWDAVVAAAAGGAGGPVLVVASDALVPGLGTTGEATTGAGAVALVLGPAGADGGAGAPCLLVARATRSMPVVDRYRADAAAVTGDVYDGRLFREEVYLPLLAAAGQAVADRMALDEPGSSPQGWALADPDGKLAGALAKRLGAPAPLSAPVQAAVGDTGAAAAIVGLAPALGEPGLVGAIGYGGGRATAVVASVRHPVPGAAEALDALGSGGRRVPYTEAIRARGQLVAMADPIPMGVPPGGAAFVRGNVEMLGLHGARCTACGTVSTPPSVHPTCIGCGGEDLEVVALGRHGTIQTFVVNQTMPPPFQAPLPLVVLDLDGGARLMVQGVPEDAASLAVGDEVDLVLRRYAVERGVPVYGFKALRRGGGAGGERRGGDEDRAGVGGAGGRGAGGDKEAAS